MVILILRDVASGRFHAGVFRESPFPGPIEDQPTGVVRLKSQGHHTTGADTLEGAQEHADQWGRLKPEAKVLRDQVADFDLSDPATILLLPRELVL